MLTLEVIVRGSSNFIGFRDICSKALLDAGFVVMLLLVLHLWGDLLEIGWRSDHFAASLFYYRISRGPKGSNISTSFIYSNSVHRLGNSATTSSRIRPYSTSFLAAAIRGIKRSSTPSQSNCGRFSRYTKLYFTSAQSRANPSILSKRAASGFTEIFGSKVTNAGSRTCRAIADSKRRRREMALSRFCKSAWVTVPVAQTAIFNLMPTFSSCPERPSRAAPRASLSASQRFVNNSS